MLDSESNSIETVLEEKGEVIVSTSGFSMYPMLRNKRDMVVIAKVNRKLRKNDVPLYRLKSGKLVLHRILKITKDGYIIRGDNLFKKERNITDKNIIGVLKAFYRDGKFYDCNKSKKYKAYVFLNRISYPLRFVWAKGLRPVLSKFKHLIFSKPGKTQ